MYCSNCGTLINDKLNYCKSCGGKIAKETKIEKPKSILEGLIVSVSLVGGIGLGILIGLVAVLLKNAVIPEVVVIISVFYLATLFGICFSLIRLISKLIDLNFAGKTEQIETYQTPLISMPNAPQLNEYHQPVGSVTENTTRNFEKVPLKEA